MDGNGDENAHLFAVDTDAAEPIARDLTPLDGVRVQFVPRSLTIPMPSSSVTPAAPAGCSISTG
jgi:hypothetical protein